MNILRDVRYAVRILRRQRAFTLLTLATLALGIGANSGIFAIVNSVLLRPLPYRDPGKVVLIEEVIRNLSPQGMAVTPSDLDEFKRGSPSFESIAGYTPAALDLTGNGPPERVDALRVSPEIFAVLGITPAIGRAFAPAEDRPRSGVAIISYSLWQRRFGGDPAIAGRVVEFNRNPTTIVGVLPKDVEFPLAGLPFGGGHQVWLPLGITPGERATIGNYNYELIGRLKQGVTMAQAQADVQAVAHRILESFPASARAGVILDAQVSAVTERVTHDSRKLLWLLLGAVGFVLLIACVNVANLLLGRAAARERELSIRSSLGASRPQLLRQLFTESLLLSMTGGAAGMLAATWLVSALGRVIPASIPRAATIAIDWRVAGFTAFLSILAGLLFGAAPALMATRTGESGRLSDTSRGATSGARRAGLRGLLIAGEVALSMVLLVGAGLLVRSLIALSSVQPGFDVQHVITARVTLPGAAYPDAASAREFFARAMQKLEALPDVAAAGAATAPLLTLRNQNLFTVKDLRFPSALAANATVLGNYFEAVGIRLRQGRLFDARDRAGSEPVLIVNETMAREYFAGVDAVGQQIKLGSPTSPDPWYTIVGVVSDVKNNELASPVKPAVYQPYAQLSDTAFSRGAGKSMVVAVKAASDPAALMAGVRAAVAQIDPQLPLSELETVRSQVADSLAPQWFQTGLVTSFAGLALLLAAVGIYGVVSFAVIQRVPEIGLRMALGASRAGVLGLVIGQGMKAVMAGVLLGLAASLALTRLIGSFLFGVPPTDWVAFCVAPVVLCMVAVAANLAPAFRAASVDPIEALRYE
jgi:putative ABC transport system permease protein